MIEQRRQPFSALCLLVLTTRCSLAFSPQYSTSHRRHLLIVFQGDDYPQTCDEQPSSILVNRTEYEVQQKTLGTSEGVEEMLQISSRHDGKSETRKMSPKEENSFDWDTFLDSPFFDPNSVLENESSNPILRRLALFVQNDYEKAEMVLSVAFICTMIVISQEFVRFQIYGSNYVPFVGGGTSSSPF